MSKSAQSIEKENASDGPRRVLEAQKSSQASSNRKGLQPGVANRVRVSCSKLFSYTIVMGSEPLNSVYILHRIMSPLGYPTSAHTSMLLPTASKIGISWRKRLYITIRRQVWTRLYEYTQNLCIPCH